MMRTQTGPRTIGALAFGAVITLSAIVAQASGAWRLVPTLLTTPRVRPMAIELADGRVAVIGGAYDLVPEMDLYDPATNTWSAGAPLTLGRSDAALARLHDGRLLLAMGNGGGGVVPVAEIYDPSADQWTRVAFTPYSAIKPSAVTLPDGRVLVAGGLDVSFQPTADTALYDANTDTWTMGPRMISARAYYNLVLLADGRVLATGGYSNHFVEGTGFLSLSQAEIYDPAANSWSAVASSAGPHVGSLAARLPDGRVLVAGGFLRSSQSSEFRSVEIYDPASNTWSAGPSLTNTRVHPFGGLMFDGRVIIASADPVTGVRSAEELLPGAAAWTPIASPQTSGTEPAGLVFAGGQRLLVAGGDAPGSGRVATSEIYDLNHRPIAVATVTNPISQTIPGQLAAVAVSAAGSSDADGDRLIYRWSSGSTVLATTNDPTTSATLGLGVGTHAITLTVSDKYGETGSTGFTATVLDGTGGLQALVGELTLQLQETQRQLAEAQQKAQVCQATITGATAAVELAWRVLFRDPSFKLPGGTPALKLGGLVAATITSPASCQKEMYRTLGGRK